VGRLLTAKEAATELKISTRTLARWKKAGVLVPIEYSRRTHRYRLADVLQLSYRPFDEKTDDPAM
jgi:predicted site-specific integrase-resolvase